jgi:hypothetical protein
MIGDLIGYNKPINMIFISMKALPQWLQTRRLLYYIVGAPLISCSRWALAYTKQYQLPWVSEIRMSGGYYYCFSSFTCLVCANKCFVAHVCYLTIVPTKTLGCSSQYHD